ncbi:N-6 DNA methylase [Paraglaciecola sp. 20A4]|uniref:Eco57I restriction-modification methylase domain-containing protein n=1 Tax=Paraglaciecola sp. 20A4 TaxID=2687288 RepID=UPI00140DAC5B|nr:N-6 DNA methylase [Paraglaciecola sp. 20A4]
MRQTLDKSLRNQLERAVVKARDIAETAAEQVLKRLNVADRQASSYLNDEQRKLRNRLRAHARQLGDELIDGQQGTKHLVVEVAYEHWHRMLFSRFLEQNSLLMYDEYTALTLEDCNELALDPDAGFGAKDGWELAGIVASKMLPQIFRIESPVFELKFSPEHQRELENIISNLDLKTFQAQDSLGWVYQFWQNKRKDEVNKSEVKIGADELSPVTQLFTEPYMVSFLLDNALGAWWADKRLKEEDFKTAVSEQELRDKAAIPGVPLEYLRFVKQHEGTEQESWTPAAGTFDIWPEHLSELKTLDPCCGSGHFLVSAFLMIVPIRMEMEDLTVNEAIDKVIAENIHGLELDQRCVEIAVFALALEAWRYEGTGGYRTLPEYNIACSGLSLEEAQKEWTQLAKGNEEVTKAVSWMKNYFKDAPILGSLIDPSKANSQLQKPWQIIQQAMLNENEISDESRVAVQGLVKAADMLSEKFDWIITNVPYKKAADLCDKLQSFLDSNYPAGCVALETAFVERCQELTSDNGVNSIVLPQNWMFLTTYKKFRKKVLSEVSISNIVRLGAGAFETISGEVVKAMLFTTCNQHNEENSFFSLDVASKKFAHDKAKAIKEKLSKNFIQKSMLSNPDFRIVIEEQGKGELFSLSAGSYVGLQNGDTDRFIQRVWEHPKLNDKWSYFQMPTTEANFYDGRSGILYWEKGEGALVESPQAYVKGREAWSKNGIAVRLTKPCPASLYSGNLYDQSSAVITPRNQDELPATYAYVSSKEFKEELEKIDQKRNVTNATFVKIPFDKQRWREVADKRFPKGLPKPYSNKPTQWIFHGHPCGAVLWDENTKWTVKGDLRIDDTVLQIAVARLLGYQWPAELDEKMELAEEQRYWVNECQKLNSFVDDDGIVCLPVVRSEDTAAKRLDDILQAAYGENWTPLLRDKLLTEVKAKSLNGWLHDKFFEQHCKLFQNRPFIWHVWDGLKDGFSALVNYHTLDKSRLERLTYTYLTSGWIKEQEQGVAKGIDGADVRLAAAVSLKERLEKIIEGEAPYDIFVRWKPLSKQPIGWNPDLNDGVRINIRPFVLVGDVDRKDAGILRAPVTKRDKNKQLGFWKKDRGSDLEFAPWYGLGLQYDGKESDRINDHHLTLTEKSSAT